MYTRKQHIVRKTTIVLASFFIGIVSTVFAIATYDATIQSRATSMFNTIKSNASAMDPQDVSAYYNLVHLNILSLIQVLTVLDTSITKEIIATTGLGEDDIIDQITNNGTDTPNSSSPVAPNDNPGTSTPTNISYINLVNGYGIDACNAQIFEKFGTQKYTCTIGGGCSQNGQPVSSSTASANPKSAGACIPKTVWDNAKTTLTKFTSTQHAFTGLTVTKGSITYYDANIDKLTLAPGDKINIIFNTTGSKSCGLNVLTADHMRSFLNYTIPANLPIGEKSLILPEFDSKNICIELKCGDSMRSLCIKPTPNICTIGYNYNANYSACVKVTTTTLNCNSALTASNWYKESASRCGEEEGIVYWNHQISLIGTEAAHKSFLSNPEVAMNNQSRQQYLNKLLCEPGATYIINSNYCKK